MDSSFVELEGRDPAVNIKIIEPNTSGLTDTLFVAPPVVLKFKGEAFHTNYTRWEIDGMLIEENIDSIGPITYDTLEYDTIKVTYYGENSNNTGSSSIKVLIADTTCVCIGFDTLGFVEVEEEEIPVLACNDSICFDINDPIDIEEPESEE